MSNAIAHRGPDDSGVYADRYAALGHRRLSIIDLAAGHQPMANETGSLQIVYNGEIFNHRDLRSELEPLGHAYRTHCDTESILHAYEQWGPKCVTSFRGMFAFAIWDPANRTLFCARDRLGKKPFYYFWDGSLFVFASEIKALLEHPAISPAFETNVLPEYLASGYVSGEGTFFRGVRKLMPGHWLNLDLSGVAPTIAVKQYWDVECESRTKASSAEWVQETRRRLEETVRMRLMSDVPLGVFLSGGVDSSAIAAIATKIKSEPVETFSVGYDDSRYSELGFAQQVATAIGSNHHEIRIGKQQFFDALPKLIWHEDEPLTWPSSVPLYFVSKLAAERVKVVLTGEGSDELFGGYERYRWNLWNMQGSAFYERLPAALRSAVNGFVSSSSLIGADARRKLSHTFFARGASIDALYLDNFYAAFSREQQAHLLTAGCSPYKEFLRYFNSREGSMLSRMLYADQKTYLLELLMKQDQMSMAASIESRVPLLDHELVEFAASIPDSLKISGTVQKYVFKKAVEDLLPREIVYRKKMGFPTPIRSWLREEAVSVSSLLLAPDSFIAPLLSRSIIQQLIERNCGGQEDCTDRIWRLLNLELWGRTLIQGKQDPGGPAFAAVDQIAV